MFFNTEILKIDEETLKKSKFLLESNELVAFPTETVYGLGGNAFSDEAVEKIFLAKGRPQDNPLIVHVHSAYDIEKLVSVDYAYVEKLKKAFLPGPLTMVYNSKGKVSRFVSCGSETLAIRIPSHTGAQEFLKYVDLPIAAPSANVSKHISPTTAKHVFDDLKGRIPMILDGGKCSGGIESTVLDVTSPVPRILRTGLVTYEMIKSVVGSCEYAQHNDGDRVRSPGVKYKHYAPKCETLLLERTEVQKGIDIYDKTVESGKRAVILADTAIVKKFGARKSIDLGATSLEIANNLYDGLHIGEEMADLIIAFKIEGYGETDLSIMNRLSKACKPD